MNRETVKRLLTLRVLASRDRRAVLLGLAVTLPVLLFVGAVKPYFAALNETRDRIAAERRLLESELDLRAGA